MLLILNNFWILCEWQSLDRPFYKVCRCDVDVCLDECLQKS
jgi:hypothetical protein